MDKDNLASFDLELDIQDGKIYGLDALRAVSVLSVIYYHCHMSEMFGWLGVNVFFVISGFLITRSLLHLDRTCLTSYLKRFYLKRTLRIFPVYYLYLFIILIISLVSTYIFKHRTYDFDTVLGSIQYALLYIYNFYHASSLFQHTRLLTHFWSLAVEEQFYLIWPLFVFFLPLKNLKQACYFFIIACPMFRLFIFLFIAPYRHSLYPPELAVSVLPFSHLDAFALGALLNFIQIRHHLFYLYSIIVLNIFLLIRTKIFFPFFPFQYATAWGYSFFNFFSTLLIYAVTRQTFLPLVFNNPILKYLGKISYGMYIFHFPITLLLLNFFQDKTFLFLMATICCTVLVSSISYHLFESYFLKIKARI